MNEILRQKTNDLGLQLIKDFEGLALDPYRCPGAVWTIGYGHTRTVREGMTVTKEEAERLLKSDLEVVESAIHKLVNVPLTSNQFSALASFVFNLGVGNFERSTMLRLLNRGWYEQVPTQLLRWNKTKGKVLKGLTSRRIAEGRLWNMPDE